MSDGINVFLIRVGKKSHWPKSVWVDSVWTLSRLDSVYGLRFTITIHELLHYNALRSQKTSIFTSSIKSLIVTLFCNFYIIEFFVKLVKELLWQNFWKFRKSWGNHYTVFWSHSKISVKSFFILKKVGKLIWRISFKWE